MNTAFPPPLHSSHTHGFVTLITILSTCFGRSSPVLSERGKEKCAGSLLFSEGCTGFNSQIIIYSLVFVILPDSCAHCKKIRIILLIYLHQLLSNLFSTFPFFVNLFLHFHLNILYFIDRDIRKIHNTFKFPCSEQVSLPSLPCLWAAFEESNAEYHQPVILSFIQLHGTQTPLVLTPFHPFVFSLLYLIWIMFSCAADIKLYCQTSFIEVFKIWQLIFVRFCFSIRICLLLICSYMENRLFLIRI